MDSHLAEGSGSRRGRDRNTGEEDSTGGFQKPAPSEIGFWGRRLGTEGGSNDDAKSAFPGRRRQEGGKTTCVRRKPRLKGTDRVAISC